MPIPDWNGQGVLPPFVGEGTAMHTRAPWRCTISEFAVRFCTSHKRREILLGFLRYRSDLRALGVAGVQWLDGSFVENVEARRKSTPHPGDIDVVTVFGPAVPVKTVDELQAFADGCGHMFSGPDMKDTYKCDAYAIPLFEPPVRVARMAAFWIGLFSHAKGDGAHKGICEILLDGNDADDKLAQAHVSAWSPPDA